MQKEESSRHAMALEQAKQLLLMNAITPNEYQELGKVKYKIAKERASAIAYMEKHL